MVVARVPAKGTAAVAKSAIRALHCIAVFATNAVSRATRSAGRVACQADRISTMSAQERTLVVGQRPCGSDSFVHSDDHVQVIPLYVTYGEAARIAGASEHGSAVYSAGRTHCNVAFSAISLGKRSEQLTTV